MADPSPSSAPRELKDTRATSSTSLASTASNASASAPAFASASTATSAPVAVPASRHGRSPSASSVSGPGGSYPGSISISHKSAHRQSFVEGLRNAPASPRSQRHPSFTQAAVQELLNHPPAPNKTANPRFAGRDWRDVSIGELVTTDDVKWVDMDSSVEEATMQLLKSPTNVVLIRETSDSQTAVSTFDYTDLNFYLLIVVGLVKPEDAQASLFNDVAAKGQAGDRIVIREVLPLFCKEPLATLSASENLAQAIQILGSGIHRILVTSQTGGVVGIASQLRIVEFFWNEGVNFPTIDRLYPAILRDLGVSTKEVVSVNSDSPLSEALTLMNMEGLTSVCLIDNGHNVVGNISTKDVRHLTSSSNAHLLHMSCMNFVSIILNERGVEKGQDVFPVFYVNPYSTLAHTVAKLVATKSHRMWVVESASPSPSAPATPLMGPQSFTAPPPPPPVALAGATPPSPVPSSAVPASAMAGARLSGRLTGVISLTDILNMFARSTGLNPSDPGEQRARRRRSSSSSVRPSLDSSRASLDIRR